MDTSEDELAIFQFTAAEVVQPTQQSEDQSPPENQKQNAEGREPNPFTPLNESIHAARKSAPSKKAMSKASSRRSKASSDTSEVRKSRRIVDKAESANQARKDEHISMEDLERQLRKHQRQSDGDFQPSSIGSSALTEINTNAPRSISKDKPNHPGKENQPIFGKRVSGGNPRKRRLTETEVNIAATRTRPPVTPKQRNNKKSLSKSLRQ
jgi:hypothetical protein